MEIKIHDLDWDVVFVPSNDEELLDGDEEGSVCGKTLKTECKILISNNLKFFLALRTIIHELVHAYVWSYGLEGTKMDEEFLCNFIETHGIDIIKQARKIHKEYKKSGK